MNTRRLATSLLALVLLAPGIRRPPLAQENRVVELTNGRWYASGAFHTGTRYMAGATFRSGRPDRVDSTLDLGGGYVVPPFGDAHSHRPGSPEAAGRGEPFLLDAGIFYVMNQGNLARYRPAFDVLDDGHPGVDARFANALIASPQSHGVDLWRRLVGGGAFPGVDASALDGDAYVILESPEDLARRWTGILETRPDFIKIMLEHSEEYAERRSDPEYFGRSGLDPALVPAIVARAHAAGLRVSAHIETAADFRTAVGAGVDMVAHLPGYDIPAGDEVATYRLDPADAVHAAERGTIVVTTTLLSVGRAEEEPARLKLMQDNQAANLRLLADRGVTLAVGSDLFSKHAVDEVLNLASLGVFDNATLLDMLCRVTPRAIFPERRIGTLEPGAEASFLVLGRDPLANLDALRDLTLRVKDGRVLESP